MSEPISRKDFLKGAGASLGVLFFRRPIERLNEITHKLEKNQSLEPTNIEGIRVYGHEQPIKNIVEYQEIVLKEQEEALPGINNDFHLLPRYELIEKRKSKLPENKRFIDVIVSETVYKQFETIDGVVNFPTWYKHYLNEKENAFLKKGVPGLDLEIVPKRIMVLTDPLMEDYKIEFNPGTDKWHRDNFGILPLDIDLRRDFGVAYMNVLGKNNYGPDGPLKVAGKNIPYDNGLIHEDYHGFFALPDWYWASGSIEDGPPYLINMLAYLNDIMGARVDNITPATAVHIQNAVKRLGFRGVFADNIPNLEVPQDAVINIQAEGISPPSIGKCLQTSGITGRSFRNQHGERLYKESELPTDQYSILNEKTLTFKAEALISGFPYLLSTLKFPDNPSSDPLIFPIPRTLFHLASWAGNEHPELDIHFNANTYPYGKQILLETVWEKDLDEYKKKNPNLKVFAGCKILDSGAVHIWAWHEGSNLVSQAMPLIIGGAAVAVSALVLNGVLNKPENI